MAMNIPINIRERLPEIPNTIILHVFKKSNRVIILLFIILIPPWGTYLQKHIHIHNMCKTHFSLECGDTCIDSQSVKIAYPGSLGDLLQVSYYLTFAITSINRSSSAYRSSAA